MSNNLSINNQNSGQQMGSVSQNKPKDDSQMADFSQVGIKDIIGKVKTDQPLSAEEMTQLQGFIEDMASQGKNVKEEFAAKLSALGIEAGSQNTTGAMSPASSRDVDDAQSGTIGSASSLTPSDTAGMSIQDKIAMLMFEAIGRQEKSIEDRYDMIAGGNNQVDQLNSINEKLGTLKAELDPTKVDDTIDISNETIQVADENGQMQDVPLTDYLTDQGFEVTDPKNMNSEALGTLQSSIKDNTESLSSTSQTDLLKLQSESSKLSRLYDLLSNMQATLSKSNESIVGNMR